MPVRKTAIILCLSFVMIIFLADCYTVNTSSVPASSATGVMVQSSEPTLASPVSHPNQGASPTTAIPLSGTPGLSGTTISSPSATVIPSTTHTLTPSITPTYAIFRGIVLEQSNCRYGPGAAYLYKYGLYEDNHLEVIGRNETGSWVVVQAIGGTNPCWIKASLMDIQGDVSNLAPAWLPLPQSPYYGPLTGVKAQRNGDEVIISWNTLPLRAGDDSEQYPYLVEAWLCQDGELQFNAIGSWETMVDVLDETGCAEPSHARVYGVEKHGYTTWVNIPWPAG